jgi:hypothetical protein
MATIFEKFRRGSADGTMPGFSVRTVKIHYLQNLQKNQDAKIDKQKINYFAKMGLT